MKLCQFSVNLTSFVLGSEDSNIIGEYFHVDFGTIWGDELRELALQGFEALFVF